MTRSEPSELLEKQLCSAKSTMEPGAAAVKAALTGSPEEKGHTGPGWLSVLSFPSVISLDMQNI